MTNTILFEHYNEIVKNINLLIHKLKNNDYDGMPVLIDSITLHLSSEEKENILTQTLYLMIGQSFNYKALESSLDKISKRFEKLRDTYSKS